MRACAHLVVVGGELGHLVENATGVHHGLTQHAREDVVTLQRRVG